MQNFETMVARHNFTLPTIADGEGQELQLTTQGVLIVTPTDFAGNTAIVQDGDDLTGGSDRGNLIYGMTTGSTVVHPIKLDQYGNVLVNVAEGNISVDFTPGTEMDVGTDESGANPEPGVLASVSTTYQIVASQQIPNGQKMAVTAFDFTADGLAQFQLVVFDGTNTTYLRTTLLPENQGTNQIVFPRPKEVTAANATTYIQLKAKSLRAGRTINVAGGINGYFPA